MTGFNNRAHQEEMAERMRNAEKVFNQQIADLEARSKSPDKLVVKENFTVDDVVSQSSLSQFTPTSEMIYGGYSPVYEGGYASRLVLEVTPDKDIPVRIITFDGLSIVKAGDYISAQIPRYSEKRIGTSSFGNRSSRNEERVFLFDRPFNPNEMAIELAILSKKGKVLRRDRSIEYTRFAKE